MRIVDFGDSVFRNLGNPEDISIPSICAWARFNINLGKLNDLLGKSFSINSSTLEILDDNGDEIDSNAAAIYELIYTINYNDRKIRQFLGAGSVDVNFLQEASSDNGTLRFINRNEIAKSYIQMKKDASDQLNKLVNYYKFGGGRASQVVGDDTNVNITSNRLGSNTIVSSNGGGISNNTT
jgi:hypothetical protein